MKFNVVEVFNRSVTIELESDAIFQQSEEYTIEIDGREVYRGTQNVVSIPGLLPDKEYTIAVKVQGTEESLKFTTKHESYLLDVTLPNSFFTSMTSVFSESKIADLNTFSE